MEQGIATLNLNLSLQNNEHVYGVKIKIIYKYLDVKGGLLLEEDKKWNRRD